MKPNYLYPVVLLLLTCCFSCKEKTPKEQEAGYLNSVINKIKVSDHYKWVVVLPGLGCHGCIQEGEAFMQKHIGNKEVLFVLTSVESLKILQNKIGIRIQDHNNVYLDKENSIHIPSDNRIYPCIIQVASGKMQRYEFQAPYNGQAFSKLETLVAAKQPG